MAVGVASRRVGGIHAASYPMHCGRDGMGPGHKKPGFELPLDLEKRAGECPKMCKGTDIRWNDKQL